MPLLQPPMAYEKLHESNSLAELSRALRSKRADASSAGHDTQSKVAGPAKTKEQKAGTKRVETQPGPADAQAEGAPQRPKKRKKALATLPAVDAVPVEQGSSMLPQDTAAGQRRRRKEKGVWCMGLAWLTLCTSTAS